MARCFRYGLFVLAAVLYSVEVSAARQVIPEPGEVQRAWVPGAGPTSFVDSRDWNATVSTQSGSRVQLPVNGKRSYGWPKWAGAAKQFVKKSPQQAAAAAGLAGVFAAVDWVMDQGQFKRPGDGGVCYHAYYGGTGMATACEYESAGDACRALYSMSGISHKGAGALSGGSCYYHHLTNVPSLVQSGYWKEVNPDPSTQPRVPVTDSEIDNLIDGITDPNVAAESAPFIEQNLPGSFDYPDGFEFSGPQSVDLPGVVTTKTDPATGNTTTTEVLPSVQFEYGTNPWSITPTDKTTKNTYENGQKTQTEESVSTDPVNHGGVSVQPKPLEIPTDCDFMPTVCKFIDWVKEPFTEQDPDLSQLIEDQDFAESVTISGNAACPAPTIIDTSRGSFEFSWQPACTWAGMIKPLVIIAALIAAIYISLGVARSE